MLDYLKDRIVTNPEVMVGKPVIKGTRITVDLILRLLSQGQRIEDILENYPQLKEEDIYAALHYADDLMQEERIFSLKRNHAQVATR